MSNKRTDDLAVYRIEKAKNDLEAAKGAFAIRRECDYEDFFVIAKEDAEKQLLVAEEFVNAVEDFVNKSLQ